MPTPPAKKVKVEGPPRQKACLPCAAAKIRCDREPPACTRCLQRSLVCEYPKSRPQQSPTSNLASAPIPTAPPRTTQHGGSVSDADRGVLQSDGGNAATPVSGLHSSGGNVAAPNRGLHSSGGDVAAPDRSGIQLRNAFYPIPLSPIESHAVTAITATETVSWAADVQDQSLDGGGVSQPAKPQTPYGQPTRSDLVCNIDAARIESRWLRPFVSGPGEKPKTYPVPVTNYIYRVLKSYISSAINGTGVPPFVHALQLNEDPANHPLTMCLRLLRICDRRLPGNQELALEPVEKEMTKIMDSRLSYDAQSLFSAFQAYLLYTMALVFEFEPSQQLDIRQAAFSLQQLASATAADGVVAPEELRSTQPDWKSWSIAEAKRRTLYTFSLLDNLLCIRDELPIFISSELQGLPAPTKGMLWRAHTSATWQIKYSLCLAQSESLSLTIDELWPVPKGMSEADIQSRRRRVDKWLEGADEFGVMLYAITSITHGE